MKVQVVRLGRWDFPGEFPTFKEGTSLMLAQEEDTEFLGWYACDIAEYKTYVPKAFVHNGKLTRDYNPTELIQEIGDILEVQEIVCAWLLATNDKGVTGWIPAACVMSVNVSFKNA